MTKLISVKQNANLIGLSDSKLRQSLLLHSMLPTRAYWQPIAFSIAITTYCNLKCPMCSRTNNKIKNIHISKEVFTKAATYFNNKTVNIVGAGEPFMHPDIFEFIEICQSHNAGVHIVTNGTLLTEKVAKQLLQYNNIQSIAFSIDGIDNTYNKIRVGSDFNLVIDNLKRISKLRTGKYPKIIANFVGMRSNISDLPRLIKLLGDYIDSMLVIHPVCFTPNISIEHLDYNAEDIEEENYVSNTLARSTKIATSHNVKLTLPNLIPTARGCIYPWTLPYIGIKGDVYPCHMYGGGDMLKSITGYYDSIPLTCNISDNILGNIMETDFNEIWNRDKIKQFRATLNKINITSLKAKYKGNDYIDMLHRGTNIYCELCPSRWDCAC